MDGDQRAWAAFLAMSERCLGVSFSALAFPPFFPPRLPSMAAMALRSALVGSGGSEEAVNRFKTA